MKYAIYTVVVMLSVLMTSCQTDSGNVVDKVLADFGLRDRPEGYESGSDRVFQQMETVGAAEMKRMNTAGRHGEVKFVEDGRRGQYHKEVKVYESFVPVDASGTTGAGARDRGFSGIIEYRYRILRGEAKPTQAEAAAQNADISSDEIGRETYRYGFSPTGIWDGAPGEPVRR
ncbi:MAG TPA: hypothetical protein PLL36_08935 [Candidatus Hydrogenedentes bacterium]|nr:MAG: hypothetical protein BWX80_04191 [Candidatus Hydrogenedentes bacterium ADurb.Bin101]HOC70327.1 hypothetical protein [Candidatus Hydrogenedentota bacterium]HQN01187.1 hypothetical protein [Candidatus Hydrogenedentota bacterium]